MPGFVNVSLLRSQQHQLAAMKACHQLFRHQRLLRRVLKQPSVETVTSLEALNEGEDVDSNSEQLLIQKLMIKATQPSPLKAIFTKEELEVFIFTFKVDLAFLKTKFIVKGYLTNVQQVPKQISLHYPLAICVTLLAI